jgi:hypothetical protein
MLRYFIYICGKYVFMNDNINKNKKNKILKLFNIIRR